MIAYVTRFLPYGLRAVSSTIIQIHKELEEVLDRLRCRFPFDLRPHRYPVAPPGNHRRMDYPRGYLYARV